MITDALACLFSPLEYPLYGFRITPSTSARSYKKTTPNPSSRQFLPRYAKLYCQNTQFVRFFHNSSLGAQFLPAYAGPFKKTTVGSSTAFGWHLKVSALTAIFVARVLNVHHLLFFIMRWQKTVDHFPSHPGFVLDVHLIGKGGGWDNFRQPRFTLQESTGVLKTEERVRNRGSKETKSGRPVIQVHPSMKSVLSIFPSVKLDEPLHSMWNNARVKTSRVEANTKSYIRLKIRQYYRTGYSRGKPHIERAFVNGAGMIG